MVDIQVDVDAVVTDPAPARETVPPRSFLAIGWVRFKPAAARTGGDELNVLGVVIVKEEKENA